MQSPQSPVNPEIPSHQPPYPKLDPYNIDTLTSEQYLRNYTYLEYMIFPELFPKLLKILSEKEKRQLLKSYVGTMRDVWPEMMEKQLQYEKAFVEEMGENNSLVKVFLGIVKEETIGNEGTVINEGNVNSNSYIRHDDNEQIQIKLSQMQHSVAELKSFPLKLTPQQLFKVRTISNSLQWIIPHSKRVQIFSQISPYILTYSQFTKHKKTNSIASALINLTTEILNDLFHQTNGHLHYSQDVPLFMYHMAIEDIYPLYRNVSRNILSSLQGITQNEGLDHIVYYQLLLKMLPLIRQTEKFIKHHGTFVNWGYLIDYVLSSGQFDYLYRIVNISETLKEFCLKRVDLKQKSTLQACNQCPKQSHLSFCQFVKKFYPEMLCKTNEIDVDLMNGSGEGKEMSMDQVEKLVRMIGRMGIKKRLQNGYQMEIQPNSLLMRRQNLRRTSNLSQQNRIHISAQFLSLYFQLFQPQTPFPANKSIYLLIKIHGHITKSLKSIITLQLFSFEAYRTKVQQCDTEANLLLESLEGFISKQNDEMRKEVKRVKYELMVGLAITKVLKTVFVRDEKDRQEEMGQNRIMQQIQPGPSIIIQQTNDLLTQILQLSQPHISPQTLLYLISTVQLHQSLRIPKLTYPKPNTLYRTILSYLTSHQVPNHQQVYLNFIRMITQHYSQLQSSKGKGDKVKLMMGLWKGFAENQGKNEGEVNLGDVVIDERLVSECLIVGMGKLVGYCFGAVRGNSLNAPQDKGQYDERQVTPHFDQLFNLNHTQKTTPQSVVKYLFNQVLLQLPLKISPQPHTTQNGLQQSQNPNQSLKTQSLELLLDQPQNVSNVFQLFRVLKRKYQQIQSLKKQINNDDATFGQFMLIEGLEQNITARSMISLMKITESVFTVCGHFVTNIMENPKPSTSFNLKEHIDKSIKEITTQLSQTIIPAYVTLFKPSPLLLEQLLKRQNLEANEQNKEKLTNQIKKLGEWLQSLRQVGIVVLVMVLWMKMEMQIVGRNGKDNGQNSRKDQGKLSLEDNPTNTLLCILTLTTLSDSLSVNYHLLQSHLQSNFQPSKQSQQQPIFPKISLTEQFTQMIRHIASYELIEFVYEYFSFEIDSQEEQMALHRLMKKWVQMQQNHHFLSEVKKGKVKLRKLTNFLQMLRKQL